MGRLLLRGKKRGGGRARAVQSIAILCKGGKQSPITSSKRDGLRGINGKAGTAFNGEEGNGEIGAEIYMMEMGGIQGKNRAAKERRLGGMAQLLAMRRGRRGRLRRAQRKRGKGGN